MKHDSHIIYRLTPPSELYACFRENKETGETKLVRWSTYVQNTGIVNGVHIGDSYEKILAEYPKAMSSQETSSDGKSKYDPQKDTSTQFSVFINKNGNIYSDNEYREMWFSTITSGFNVNNGMVTGIAFGDMQSTKLV